MTREQMIKIYESARYIYTVSRLVDVRKEARSICIAVENFIGQLGSQPAETWKD
jgi:hypothetical protein